jgi:hypothetical protein
MGHLANLPFKDLAEKHGAKVFIETGTGMGVGLLNVIQSGAFSEYHSIEIVPELAALARRRFASHPEVTIHEGHTLDILPDLLARHPDECCFVWLDAHYPGADFGLAGYDDEKDPDKKLPLQKELALFEARNDIVIADDLSIYTGQHWNYGGHETFHLPSYAKIDKLDIRRMHDRHEVYVHHHEEGFLLFLPRPAPPQPEEAKT